MAADRKVFREYIGAQWQGVRFGDIHVNRAVDVHFILAFAIDYNTDNPAMPIIPNNGHFHVFWDTRFLTPATLRAVKQRHPNVKVMLSVGGATVRDKPVKFAPAGEDSWVDNAFRTLTGIIDEYGLDGVDINYEGFVGDADRFARCIGRLLERLKARNRNTITSIAPYKWIDGYYEALWRAHQSKIDYVNYQFYADGPVVTESQYVHNYNVKSQLYGRKLLAAINTSKPEEVQIVARNVALGACQQLANQRRLQAGIFIWSADSSFANKWPEANYEQRAQAIVQQAKNNM